MPTCLFCCRSWLITGRGVAKKIRNAPHCSSRPISELGAEAQMECPNCKHVIDNSDVSISLQYLLSTIHFCKFILWKIDIPLNFGVSHFLKPSSGT